jgi:hypothetical protein
MLVTKPFEFYSVPINANVFPPLSCTNSKVSVQILRSLIHFELILAQSERHGSNLVFCRQIYCLYSDICWRVCLFLIICFWHLCQKSGWYSHLDSQLGLLFCHSDLHICFYASFYAVFIAMALYYSLKLNVVIPSVLLFFAQYCLCNTLMLIFNHCDEWHWDFHGHHNFHNIDVTNPRVWEIFPSSVVLFISSML